jgi:hypothetical protein
MKLIKLFLITIMLSSCCEIYDVTKYTNGEVIITRVDECGTTTFYYGDEINKNIPKIWTKYSGINDGFKGYLQFNEKGKVILLSGDGYFQAKNLDSIKFNYKRILSYQRPKIGKNVCYINLATKFENEDNIAEGSGIKVEYLDKDW